MSENTSVEDISYEKTIEMLFDGPTGDDLERLLCGISDAVSAGQVRASKG